MREGWVDLTLGDVCKFENGDRGNNYPGRKAFTNSGVPFINAGHLNDGAVDWSSMNFIPEEHFQRIGNGKIKIGDLLFCLRGSLGKFGIVNRDTKGAIASSLVIIRPTEHMDPGYLAAYFRSNICSSMIDRYSNGAAQPNLSAKCLKSFEIPLPPLPEQKRIVEILDEAFAGIDTAIANTKKNLANTRELFEGYLNSVFSRALVEWKKTPLEKHIKFIDYRGRTPKKTLSGLRLITAKNVRMGYLQREPEEFVDPETYDTWMTRGIPKKWDVLFTTEAPLGLVCQLDSEDKVVFAQRVITMQPDREIIYPDYLKFALRSSPIQSRIHEKATGATATGIKASLLKKITIPIPEFDVQKVIAENADCFEQESKRLESIYQQKLTALTELKQSLLQKAFSGELTADNVVPISSAKKSSAIPTTDSPAFAAHIMAVAYHWHESRGKNKTFGHVKAQKTLHLVEALAQIDLGRAPIKDAAGPNDFAHMRTTEQWAREHDYYDFVQRPSGQRGYDFVKGARYSEWLARGLGAVEPYKSALDRAVSLLMPLDTQKAELVATVYAAWNNLLLDGHEPTEADIVYEARDNWHPDKQQYSQQQFREAIDRLRSNGMVPTGAGKRVTGQESFEL